MLVAREVSQRKESDMVEAIVMLVIASVGLVLIGMGQLEKHLP